MSTRTLVAIPAGTQVTLRASAQVGREPIHHADEVGDRREWVTPGAVGPPWRMAEALANDIGLGHPSGSRLRLDLGNQWSRKAHGERLHCGDRITHVSDMQDADINGAPRRVRHVDGR